MVDFDLMYLFEGSLGIRISLMFLFGKTELNGPIHYLLFSGRGLIGINLRAVDL